jgi:hypothetical protein
MADGFILFIAHRPGDGTGRLSMLKTSFYSSKYHHGQGPYNKRYYRIRGQHFHHFQVSIGA